MRKQITKRVFALVLTLALVLTGNLAGNLASAASAPKMKTKSVNILVGKAKQLKLTGITKTSPVVYTSSKKKVAKVSATGKVKGVKKGKAVITARVSKNGKVYKLKSKVTVRKGAKKLYFVDADAKTIKSITMTEGEELTLKVKQSPKSANDLITFSSSDTDLVEVTKSGKATAFVAGKATITAKSLSGKKVKLTVNVVEEKAATSSVPSTSPAVSTKPSTSEVPAISASPATSASPSATPSVTPSVGPSTLPTLPPSPNSTTIPPTLAPDGEINTDDSNPPRTMTESEVTAAIADKTQLLASTFDGNSSIIVGRSGGGSVEASDNGHGDTSSIRVYNRRDNWHGAAVDTSVLSPMAGGQYYFEAYVMQNSGTSQRIAMKIQCSGDSGTIYPWVGCTDTDSGEWKLINGIINLPANASGAMLYFEVPTSTSCDFYIDDFKAYGKEPEAPELGSLYDAYKDYFSIGCAVTPAQLSNATKLSHIKSQYNSITLENQMKPDAVLGSSATLVDVSQAEYPVPDSYHETKVPKLNLTQADAAMKIASENGLKMRYHTLVWHSQTPTWFFREGYSSTGAFVSKDVMNARMENYIKQVMSHVQASAYANVVYCYDVCNEVFTNSGGGLRGSVSSANENSDWYTVYGSNEFIIKAFTYAKKYRANDNIKLFYNDYNEYIPAKTNDICGLIDVLNADPGNKLLDGVGMQSHYDIDYPKVDNVESAIDRFHAKGVEIQLTEVDCTIGSASDFARQATFYGDLFTMLVKKKNAGVNITNVTLWGLDDSVSWRATKLPLIFSANFMPKPAYDSILAAVGASRPTAG